ncbi:MAG: N5-glutamine methyltransferase family protein [Actinomycetota bacterium]
MFVPRPQTEVLARRAVSLLPEDGIAVDLCTGSGAVAAVLAAARPRATLVATDVDPVAVACARRNGVDALVGNLDEPLSPALAGRVDVITAVVPYVSTEKLHLLPRDVLANEPRLALDGGARGTTVLERPARAAARWLRPGGSVLLELGGDQASEVARTLAAVGLSEIRVHREPTGRTAQSKRDARARRREVQPWLNAVIQGLGIRVLHHKDLGRRGRGQSASYTLQPSLCAAVALFGEVNPRLRLLRALPT